MCARKVIGTYTTLYENSIQYYTTLGPLVVIIGFTLVKEGLEDKKRHESDNEVTHGRSERTTAGGPLFGARPPTLM